MTEILQGDSASFESGTVAFVPVNSPYSYNLYCSIITTVPALPPSYISHTVDVLEQLDNDDEMCRTPEEYLEDFFEGVLLDGDLDAALELVAIIESEDRSEEKNKETQSPDDILFEPIVEDKDKEEESPPSPPMGDYC